MLTLFLAVTLNALSTGYTTTTIDPNPYVPGGYIITMPNPVPTSPPVLSMGEQIMDAQFASNPNLQRDAYNFDALKNKYPVQSVMPVQTRPLEDQIAYDQARNQMQSQQLSLQQQAFKNQAMQSDFNYQQKVIGQASNALQEIGDLNPAAPDYMQQRSNFFKKYPLGNQNPYVSRALGTLDDQYNNYQHVDRSDIGSARGLLSQNPELLAQFENTVQQNGGKIQNPVGYASTLLNQGHQETLAGQLGAFTKDLSPYRENPDDPQSPLDPAIAGPALYRFQQRQKMNDALAQKQELDQSRQDHPITRSEYNAMVERQNAMLRNGQGIDDLNDDQKKTFDFLSSQMREYEDQHTGQSSNAVTPSSLVGATSTRTQASPANTTSGADAQEGTIIFNRKTGERKQLKNGAWVTIK